MNSVQAYIEKTNLDNYEKKLNRLLTVRSKYNNAFDLANDSNHLYRVSVVNNNFVMQKLRSEFGIITGIHYKCLHNYTIYNGETKSLPLSEKAEQETLSIPFHENLTDADVDYVIEKVKLYLK